MKTKRSLDDILAEAGTEMEQWSPQMKRMVEIRRLGLEYVAAEEQRGESNVATSTVVNRASST